MPFHIEGIGWPGSNFYSFISQGRFANDIYESVIKDVADEVIQGKILDVGTGPARLL